MFHVVKTHSNRLDVTILIPNPTSIMKTEKFFLVIQCTLLKRKDGQTEHQKSLIFKKTKAKSNKTFRCLGI